MQAVTLESIGAYCRRFSRYHWLAIRLEMERHQIVVQSLNFQPTTYLDMSLLNLSDFHSYILLSLFEAAVLATSTVALPNSGMFKILWIVV